MILFAICDSKQESLGFSPAKLVFGHNIRGPLKVLQEQFLSKHIEKINVFDFVSRCRERLHKAITLVREAISSCQADMKRRLIRR